MKRPKGTKIYPLLDKIIVIKMKEYSFMSTGMLVQKLNLQQYGQKCENRCLSISTFTCVSFLGFIYGLSYMIVDLGYFTCISGPTSISCELYVN